IMSLAALTCGPFRSRSLTFLTAAILCAVGSFSNAIAAEVYGDWELVCTANEDINHTSPCRLQQAQAVNEGRDVVFLFNVIAQADGNVGLISAPLETYLPAGIALRLDKGKSRQAAFETCNLAGCHAGFRLDQAFLSGLKKGLILTATLMDTKATKVDVPVSLKGFAAGFAALQARKSGAR
ncbi:Invasion associated locus B family protein, partial [Rhizobium sp. PDO1-076]|uniref:invasion associated locus B family protein n=2 Tax=Rhizobium TaxID=379 RepID=UPI00024E3E3F